MEYLWKVNTSAPAAERNLLTQCGADLLKLCTGYQIYSTKTNVVDLNTAFGPAFVRMYDVGDSFEYLDRTMTVDKYVVANINDKIDVNYSCTSNKGEKIAMYQSQIP